MFLVLISSGGFLLKSIVILFFDMKVYSFNRNGILNNIVYQKTF
jgi:hypothetical protein